MPLKFRSCFLPQHNLPYQTEGKPILKEEGIWIVDLVLGWGVGTVSECGVWLRLKTLLLNRCWNSYPLPCNILSQNLLAHVHRPPFHPVSTQSWISHLSQLPCPSSSCLLIHTLRHMRIPYGIRCKSSFCEREDKIS